jgi:UPF0755 protein
MIDEPTAAPRPRGSERLARVRRRRRWLLLAGIVALLVVVPVAWFVLEAYPIGGAGKPVAFEVQQGEPFGTIADTLAAKGIIGSATALRVDFALTGTPTVRPGWYLLPTSSSFPAVRNVLSGGPNATVLGVYTGQTVREIAQNLVGTVGPNYATRFRTLALAGAVASTYQRSPRDSLEGLLAPGVYVIVPNESPRTLLTQMVARFEARARGAGLTAGTASHGLDAYGLLTAASIVEKEGYQPRNMPKTATVVYNRLAHAMPLQMDSTVLYATGQDGGTVTHATEQIDSPYNTYLHTGLTPTPICIPSTEAIDAVLHPANGPWLYFTLVDRSGTLAFSSTFAQQLANERLAQRRGV